MSLFWKDFEMQQQYFDKKVIGLSKYCFIALSFYRNIACENRSSDESLTVHLKAAT